MLVVVAGQQEPVLATGWTVYHSLVNGFEPRPQALSTKGVAAGPGSKGGDWLLSLGERPVINRAIVRDIDGANLDSPGLIKGSVLSHVGGLGEQTAMIFRAGSKERDQRAEGPFSLRSPYSP